MAKKRGRPPTTPSSLAKKTPSKTLEEPEQQKSLDFTQLDEEDLEDLENLTPKKAGELLKNLDMLREKFKEKIGLMNENLSPIKVNEENVGQPNEKTTPVEVKVTVENHEAKGDSMVHVQSIASSSKVDNVADAVSGSFVAETGSKDQGEKEVDNEVNQNDDGQAIADLIVNEENETDKPEQGQPWITVQTRSKTQGRYVLNKEKRALQEFQASKAYG
ncbi:hypothetical protein RIF29_03879 [Crotalaria pallida]|uniref:Uncharacterized protein n=1 Tax=Crotalaria pallida TaxID=3830 RepID=A0AAN9P8X1_CROPI